MYTLSIHLCVLTSFPAVSKRDSFYDKMKKNKNTQRPIPITHKWIGFFSILVIVLIWISQALWSKILITLIAIIIMFLNASGRNK